MKSINQLDSKIVDEAWIDSGVDLRQYNPALPSPGALDGLAAWYRGAAA